MGGNTDGFFWSMVVAAFLFLFFVVYLIEEKNDVKEQLGQAICEERFDRDFDSYSNKQLKCKDKEIVYQKQSDGITVEIG